MSLISDILAHNTSFVQNKEYEPFRTDRFPDKKLVVLTCMDTRLVELLPHAMNLRQGDAKFVKNAGAIVSHPFGSIMRSILLAIYELGVGEVAVVGHHGCGMTGLNAGQILAKARERGVSQEVLVTLRHGGVDMQQWLTGFESPEDGVKQSVEIVRNHPLLPRGIPVHGLIIHPETGKLDLLADGYQWLRRTPTSSDPTSPSSSSAAPRR
ncbi:MAG TPA: carbonic anhydrase [Tepidisphaeraceae bacterium]|jgi:carbonic anhydrase|nr:carbonic anhydrase [Tepidisphaeraceae bacterium]